MLFLERLSDADLALLAEAAGESGSVAQRVADLRRNPRGIDALLGRPDVFESLFGTGQRDPLVVVAPFLAFAVLLSRAARILGEVNFVEWVAPRRRVPVFDVDAMRHFVSDPLRRFFLTELLTSYTHVASGSVWTRTAHGWRRRRFSELDPIRLAELIDAVSEHERPLLYRRLGDLALFLTGVFPDFASQRLLGPGGAGRLHRALWPGSGGSGGGRASGETTEVLALLETLGRRCYRLAWEATQPGEVGLAKVLGELAEHFGPARRVLNFLTDRYLFPYRQQWFGPAGA